MSPSNMQTHASEAHGCFTKPPFSNRMTAALSVTYTPPIAVRTANHGFLQWKEDPKECLSIEILTPELDKISRYLWFAGLPRPARPLHRQRLMGRTIWLTERVQEHLVWHESWMFLKPLPGYLLNYAFWEQYLCGSSKLYQHSCGLLMSYMWLVSTETDFRIALEVGLIPDSIRWTTWQILIEDLLQTWSENSLHVLVSQRYHYGELRLSRLKLFHQLQRPLFTLKRNNSSYLRSSTWFDAYMSKKFRWLLAIFVYISVILSAMQVGLASDYLADHTTFRIYSGAFALAAICLIATATVAFCIVSVFLFGYNILLTLNFHKGLSECQEGYRLNTKLEGLV